MVSLFVGLSDNIAVLNLNSPILFSSLFPFVIIILVILRPYEMSFYKELIFFFAVFSLPFSFIYI